MSDDDKNKKNDDYDFFKLSPEEKNDRNNGQKKRPHFSFFALILVAILGYGIFNLVSARRAESEMEFSDFKALVEDGTIKEVDITDYYYLGYDSVSTENKENIFSSILTR